MGDRLQDKTVLVTGSTSNIGRAIAIAFAGEGARVIVSGRNSPRGMEVVGRISARGRGQARFIAADLDGTAEASRRLARDACDAYSAPIDVLVNNAGIFPSATTLTVDDAMFDRVYAVNVKAPFFLTAALAPAMQRHGAGSIINLGSWIARLGIPVGALYASTKGAMETLTRAWAAEFGSATVRINAISPGVVREQTDNDPAAAMMRGTPYGAFGSPEAIANAAIFLASDEARFVNGTVLDVDGGRTSVAVISR